MERVAFLRKHVPEQPWPVWDDASLGELLAKASAGKTSLAQVQKHGLCAVLRDSLPWVLSRRIELARRTLRVPSGSDIRPRLRQPPVLAVRLQEVFGLETPRIAAGALPLVMHLLGPNYRPCRSPATWRASGAPPTPVRKRGRCMCAAQHSWPEGRLMPRKPRAAGGLHSRCAFPGGRHVLDSGRRDGYLHAPCCDPAVSSWMNDGSVPHCQGFHGTESAPNQVAATAALLAEDATVPFIARYRKEATGSLDEVQITSIRDRLASLRELDARGRHPWLRWKSESC